MKPRILCWLSIPSPYMVERLNTLVERGNLDLEVWFNARSRKFRSWKVDENEWKFRHRYIRTFRIFGHDYGWPPLLSGRHAPDVLFMLYGEPVFILGWLMSRIRGLKAVFFIEERAPSLHPKGFLREFVKGLMFKGSAGLLYSGEEAGENARRHHRPGRLFAPLPHVIDVSHYGKELDPAEREKLRSRLGLSGVVFLYVGRLAKEKGLESLLRAFSALQKSLAQEVSLLLVGDGKYEHELRRIADRESLRNVAFAGFVQKHEIVPYFAAADVFVFPTLGDAYGLAVDEAMAAGLPVISTSAAGDIGARIKRDGTDGFVVPPNDAGALGEKMKALALSPELRRSMGGEGRKWAEPRTLAWWAGNFERGMLEAAGGG